MATILRGSYNIDQIETLANLIKDNAGFSSTDFSVADVYDFIVNSKAKLRLKAASATTLGLYTVVGTTEASIASGAYLSIRIVATNKATAIGATGGSSEAEVLPNHSLILRAESKSTLDSDIDDILLVATAAKIATGIKFFAPDMLAQGSTSSMGTAPNASNLILNTVLYKVSGNTTYYIPESVYFIRAINADVDNSYYNFDLNSNTYETVGYWALRDDEA